MACSPRLSVVLLVLLAFVAACVPSAASAAGGGVAAAGAVQKAKPNSAKSKAKPKSKAKAKRRTVKRRVPLKPTHPTATAEAVAPAITAPASAPGTTDCGNTSQVPTADGDATAAAAILCLVNNERALAGLRPLVRNGALDTAAQIHSGDMVAKQYFEHADPLGVGATARVLAAGWATLTQRWRVGENIAWGSGPYASPTSVVERWMNSPPHRENILAPDFREIGVGVAAGSPMPQRLAGATYTIDLGVRG